MIPEISMILGQQAALGCTTFPVILLFSSLSFCSVYNPGEDATSAPVRSEVDERQSMGMLVSPPFTQERERGKCISIKDFITLAEKTCVQFITHSEHGETCGDVLAQEKIMPRSKCYQRSLTPSKKGSLLSVEKSEIFLNCKGRSSRTWRTGSSIKKISEAEYDTGLLLEEQKNHLSIV